MRQTPYQAGRRKNARRGYALVMTTMMLLGISLLVLATVLLTDTSSKIAHRGALKVQTTTLAETGLHSFYDTIRTTMVANNGTAYPAAPTTATTLTCTINGTTRTLGTYTAQYVGTPSSTTKSVSLGTQTQTDWKFTILGIGASANGGTVSKVQASFTASVIQNNALVSLSGSAALGPGAIQSATTVNFRTDGGVRVYDASGLNNANVIANGGIGWVPYSMARESSNPNLVYAEGNFQVPGAPSAAWTYTNSATTGLYKSAGNAIYQSTSNLISALSAPATFASASQVSAWQSNWITQSQSTGNTYNGSVNASSVAPNPTNPGQGEHRITAPAYINGDLNVDSNQLYLQPNSNTTKSNVIYVTGNVNNGALLYNRGVNLVVVGKYVETNGSAMYQLQTQNSPYSTMNALYGAAALVSLKASNDAITMITSSSSGPGLIYAALGGISVSGQNEMDGVLISGGLGSAGGINIFPQNGNSFVVKYQSACVVGRNDFNLSVSVGGSIAQAFTPTRMNQWLQVQ